MIYLPLLSSAAKWTRPDTLHKSLWHKYIIGDILELVSKELNHLAAILHVYAGGLNFMLLFFKKKMEILLHF